MRVTQIQINKMEMLRVKEWDTWVSLQYFARYFRLYHWEFAYNQ